MKIFIDDKILNLGNIPKEPITRIYNPEGDCVVEVDSVLEFDYIRLQIKKAKSYGWSYSVSSDSHKTKLPISIQGYLDFKNAPAHLMLPGDAWESVLDQLIDI